MANDTGAEDTVRLLASVAPVAERVSGVALGGPVRLGEGQLLGGFGRRTTTVRFPLRQAPGEAPVSVIAKWVRGYRQGFDPADTDAAWAARRLGNEWTGLQFLEGALQDSGQSLVSPRCYGGDQGVGLVVFEDLGDGECLADLLQGNDPVRAESCLLAYATALGRMHAATTGRARDYERLRSELGFATPHSVGPTGWLHEEKSWLTGDVVAFRKGCASIGFELPTVFDEAAAAVAAAMERPGPFLAFTPSDSCPDNHRFIAGEVRLFDFEGSTFRHALLDAAYARVPFPTCWCVNRLPAALVQRFEAAYRQAFLKGCPDIADDAIFGRELVAACAFWTIGTISWNLPRTLQEDDRWGLATVRQRHLLRLETLAAATEQFGYLEALGAMARQLRARLMQLWTVDNMPLYPAFRQDAP